MCPISKLVQLLIIVVTILLTCQAAITKAWEISHKPDEPIVHMYDSLVVSFNVTAPDKVGTNTDKYYMEINTGNHDILEAEKNVILLDDNGFTTGNFSINGNFLGRTNVNFKVKANRTNTVEYEKNIEVKVIRKKRVIDIVFAASVATLVSIIYINFGCALNWADLKTSLKKPIGPLIGCIGQFIFMPLISYCLGKVLFPDNAEMQLGIFFTGVSPGGGASNMWTLILGGDLNLSITMTTISTFAAFFMMPLWLFTLGKVIFKDGNLEVPYKEISTYAVALVVPLFIGYLIQRYLKRVGQFMAKILKGFASLLLIFIIIFAIIANLYIFKLFSWEIVVAGIGLPWLGYLLAFALAKICRQSYKSCLTIAIETGIQNTGIAIFLLRFTLPQPAGDITTIGPVAVATMTPIPLLCLYVYQKIKKRIYNSDNKNVLPSELTESDLSKNSSNQSDKPMLKETY